MANVSVVQQFNLGIGRGTEARFDELNITDTEYEFRDGTGVGVGAPQYGSRRAVLGGLTLLF